MCNYWKLSTCHAIPNDRLRKGFTGTSLPSQQMKYQIKVANQCCGNIHKEWLCQGADSNVLSGTTVLKSWQLACTYRWGGRVPGVWPYTGRLVGMGTFLGSFHLPCPVWRHGAFLLRKTTSACPAGLNPPSLGKEDRGGAPEGFSSQLGYLKAAMLSIATRTVLITFHI